VADADTAVVRRATTADLPHLLDLCAEYYAEEGYRWSEAGVRRAFEELLPDPSRGGAWITTLSQHAVGYAVLTLGHSIEYHGRDGFVDEIYVRPTCRRRGVARALLRALEQEAVAAGVRALHLEVERGKEAVQALYHRLGFEDHDRVLMTKRLG
jgi:ribosomal protein S18 acetylase RimI-like enzyme